VATGRARTVAGGAWAGDSPSSGGNKRRRGDGRKACEEAERVGSVDFLELARSGFLRNGFALMFSNQMCIKWNGAAPFHQMPPNTYLNEG
jgi:hypothetical protein